MVIGRYWEIHSFRPRDFPRPSRFPSGNLLGLGKLGGGDGFPNTSLVLVEHGYNVLKSGNMILLKKMANPVQSVKFVEISTRTNVRIHSYPKNYTNECLNIFITKIWRERMSKYIFDGKLYEYLNTFEYSNSFTLYHSERTNVRIYSYDFFYMSECPNIFV